MIKKALSIVRKEASTNESGGFVSFVASTNTEDRYGDVIDQAGWNLASYEKNPVVLLNHNPMALPIGRGLVEVKDGSLMIDVEFDLGDPTGAEVARKADAGFLHSVSVGFRAIESTPRSKLPTEHKHSGSDGVFFSRSELLEVSIVTIPANPDASISARSHDDLDDRIRSIVRGEVGAIPSLQLRHILDVSETDDSITITFSKPIEETPADEEIEEEIEEETETMDETEDKDFNLAALAAFLSQ